MVHRRAQCRRTVYCEWKDFRDPYASNNNNKRNKYKAKSWYDLSQKKKKTKFRLKFV